MQKGRSWTQSSGAVRTDRVRNQLLLQQRCQLVIWSKTAGFQATDGNICNLKTISENLWMISTLPSNSNKEDKNQVIWHPITVLDHNHPRDEGIQATPILSNSVVSLDWGWSPWTSLTLIVILLSEIRGICLSRQLPAVLRKYYSITRSNEWKHKNITLVLPSSVTCSPAVPILLPIYFIILQSYSREYLNFVVLMTETKLGKNQNNLKQITAFSVSPTPFNTPIFNWSQSTSPNLCLYSPPQGKLQSLRHEGQTTL